MIATEGMETTEDEEATGTEINTIIHRVSLYLRRRTISKKSQWEII